MREESWYASIYDEQGNIRQGLSGEGPVSPSTGEVGLAAGRRMPPETEMSLSPLEGSGRCRGRKPFR